MRDGGGSKVKLANLSLLIRYERAWLRGDVVAGVTVAAYLVPQVMAYAQVAGLPPIAGLWAILPCMIIYAVLGSSRQLSVGPESTTALLTASIVARSRAETRPNTPALRRISVGLRHILPYRMGTATRICRRCALSAGISGYLSGVALILIVDSSAR
jgi:MFS superfamily sulfate permease-like transporter